MGRQFNTKKYATLYIPYYDIKVAQPSADTGYYILQENSFNLLQENNYALLLESAP